MYQELLSTHCWPYCQQTLAFGVQGVTLTKPFGSTVVAQSRGVGGLVVCAVVGIGVSVGGSIVEADDEKVGRAS